MSKQPPPAPTASAVGPCPTVIQIVGRPGTGSLPSTIAPPDHPLYGLKVKRNMFPCKRTVALYLQEKFSPLLKSYWKTKPSYADFFFATAIAFKACKREGLLSQSPDRFLICVEKECYNACEDIANAGKTTFQFVQKTKKKKKKKKEEDWGR